eukprot:6207070-Pleurochrysis_carterae.AAC.2
MAAWSTCDTPLVCDLACDLHAEMCIRFVCVQERRPQQPGSREQSRCGALALERCAKTMCFPKSAEGSETGGH